MDRWQAAQFLADDRSNVARSLGLSDVRTVSIVSHGTENGWAFRMWSDGTAEAWRTVSRIGATAQYDDADWGYRIAADPVAYPAGLFAETPHVSCTARGVFGFVLLAGVGSAYQTPSMYLYRPTAISGANVYFDLTVRGRWK